MAGKPPIRLLPPLSEEAREETPAAPAARRRALPLVVSAGGEETALPLGPPRLPPAVSPMFPGGASEPFSSPDHLFEVRWDGLRALAFVEGGGYHLQDQSGRNITELFPELSDLLHRVRTDQVILDGVVVVCDASGRPDFAALDRRMRLHSAGGLERAAARQPAAYVVFDLLYHEARAVTNLTLLKRRRLLRQTIDAGGRVALSDAVAGEGEALFEAAREMGIDAVIAKRKDSPYVPGGRVPSWLLVQDVPRQDVVVVGFIPGFQPEGAPAGATETFETLLLGIHGVAGAEANRPVYVGAVGGGFDRATERLLSAVLPGLRAGATAPLRHERVPPEAVWVRPELVVSVKFSEWTAEGMLRFPIFVGMHPEVAPRDCVRQQLMPPRRPRPRRAGIAVELPQLPFARSHGPHGPG
jgi:bifunctional non-homologous end joining protein LigD